MKLRNFSIRDLLWLTALCAVLVAWWMDHRRLNDLLDEEEVTVSGIVVQIYPVDNDE